MAFVPGDRVEHAECDHKGTIEKEEGEHVWVRWDDGMTGILKYDRSVWFNAYNLHKLASGSNA